MELENFGKAISIITIVKSTFFISILSIINFIYLLTYKIMKKEDLKNLKNAYKLANEETINKSSVYSVAISFLKELYSIAFEVTLVILSMLSKHHQLSNHMKYIYVLIFPMLFTRIKELLKSREFVESEVLNKQLKKGFISRIIYSISYLSLPIILLSLGLGIHNNNSNIFSKIYFLTGTFFYILIKLLNLFANNTLYSSESFWGLLFEFLAFGMLGGAFWFSPIISVTCNLLIKNKYLIHFYVIIFLLLFTVLVNLLRPENKGR